MSFLVCLTIRGNEDLLKLEIQERGLDWKLSFSRPGLLSFKTTDPPIDLAFSLGVMRPTGRVSSEEDKKTNFHYEVMGKDWLEFSPEDAHKLSQRLKVAEANEQAPSRAYGKIKEVSYRLGENFKSSLRVLELGSAPGGASYFLLENGFKVTGVDPAQMDSKISRHSQFLHLNLPVQKLVEELRKWPTRYDVLVSDLNLAARDNLIWNKKIMAELGSRLDLAIITLKANGPLDVKSIIHHGIEGAQLWQLPSHKRECVLIWHRKTSG